MKAILCLGLGLFALRGCLPETAAPPPPVVDDKVTIRITTAPRGASVLLDGKKLKHQTPLVVKQDNRGHMLEIRYPGYQTVWRRIEPSRPGFEHNLDDLELKPKALPLILNSKPSGALVSLDGQDMGKTPIYLKKVLLGEHQAVFKFPGYESRRVVVNLLEGEPVIINKTLESLMGTVRVITSPAGAQVFLDGGAVGRTPKDGGPLTLAEVEEGKHILTIKKKPGYQDLEMPFTLKRHENKLIRTPELEPSPGTVTITSEPAGANVHRGVIFLGKTPVTLKDLAPGPIKVTVAKKGYGKITRTINVLAGIAKTVELALEKNFGSVSFIAAPPGAIIYIDGNRVGKTEAGEAPGISKLFVYEGLKPGTHVLRVAKSGFARREKQFLVQKGKETSFKKIIKLKKLWLPTHEMKTRKRAKTYRVRVLRETATKIEVEIYNRKDGSKVRWEVERADIAHLKPL